MEMTFSQTNCFLCGLDISQNVTEEHIFPKWLQNKYDLWDETIVLLNGTKMPYRLIKIPCCQTCNGEYLSKLEGRISKAVVNGGYEEFIKLDEDDIFYWSAKLMYGMFFKELTLNVDRRNPDLGKITTPEVMERFRTLHFLLQGIRIKTQFTPVKPYSLFIFKVKETENPINRFDYIDNYSQQVYSMRMGDIGFVICFEDSSLHKEMHGEYYDRFQDKTLHQMQLREIFARVVNKQIFANFVPNYLSIGNNDHHDRVVWVNQPLGEVFSEGSPEIFAHALRAAWRDFGIELEDIYLPPDRIATCLEYEDGSFIDIPADLIVEFKFN